MKRSYWIIGIVLALLIAGFVAVRVFASNRAAAATPNVQTAAVRRGTVESTSSSAGTVRSGQNATVSWGTTGQVGAVNVQPGQQVKAGDRLASLDQATLPTSIIQAQSDLLSAQQTLEDLKKPDPLKIAQAQTALNTAQTNLDNLQHPSETAIQTAQKAVLDAQDTLTTAQYHFDTLKYQRGTPSQRDAAQASYIIAQTEVNRLQKMYNSMRGDPAKDAPKALALTNLSAAQSKMNSALALVNWYNGKPTQADIDQFTNALNLAKGQLADAQKTLDTLLHPTQDDITAAQAAVTDAQTTLDTVKAGPTQADLTAAQTRVLLVQAALAQANLTAPFAGTITDVQSLKGDLVKAGQAAFRIDDLSNLFVDLQVSEVDVPNLKVGQDATLTFDAIPGKNYNGKVSKIGMVGTVSQGVVNYPVTVQITDGDSSVLSGMTAAVNIVTAQHPDVLVVPNNAIKSSGGQRYVTVLYQGQQIQVPVQVGLVGDTATEVTSNGLKEGDEVVVSATTGTTTNRNGGGGFPGGGGGGGGFFIGR